MTIDIFTAGGEKKGKLELPKELFEARINPGLMHQAVVRQQSNRRNAIAHVKNRGEVQGSTKKLYAQKHTGRARRGSIRSPLLRGGGKAFGPRHDANFEKDMPKSMRRAALLSCLSHRARQGAIIGLENYPKTIKTKHMHDLLKKLPVDIGRRILFVLPEVQESLWLSARNIPGVKVLQVAYLNPEDVLNSRHIIFMVEAVKKAEAWLTKKEGMKLSKGREENETIHRSQTKHKNATTPKVHGTKTKKIQKKQKIQKKDVEHDSEVSSSKRKTASSSKKSKTSSSLPTEAPKGAKEGESSASSESSES